LSDNRPTPQNLATAGRPVNRFFPFFFFKYKWLYQSLQALVKPKIWEGSRRKWVKPSNGAECGAVAGVVFYLAKKPDRHEKISAALALGGPRPAGGFSGIFADFELNAISSVYFLWALVWVLYRNATQVIDL
jgi:hypothetical protein